MGNLYSIIIDLCKQKGITGGKMCTDLGISKGTLTDLKMGRQKSLSTGKAQLIAEYLGVTVDYLLGKENAPTENGERDVLDEVDVGFYNGFKELTEEQQEVIRRMVQVMRGQHPNNNDE